MKRIRFRNGLLLLPEDACACSVEDKRNGCFHLDMHLYPSGLIAAMACRFPRRTSRVYQTSRSYLICKRNSSSLATHGKSFVP